MIWKIQLGGHLDMLFFQFQIGLSMKVKQPQSSGKEARDRLRKMGKEVLWEMLKIPESEKIQANIYINITLCQTSLGNYNDAIGLVLFRAKTMKKIH